MPRSGRNAEAAASWPVSSRHCVFHTMIAFDDARRAYNDPDGRRRRGTMQRRRAWDLPRIGSVDCAILEIIGVDAADDLRLDRNDRRRPERQTAGPRESRQVAIMFAPADPQSCRQPLSATRLPTIPELGRRTRTNGKNFVFVSAKLGAHPARKRPLANAAQMAPRLARREARAPVPFAWRAGGSARGRALSRIGRPRAAALARAMRLLARRARIAVRRMMGPVRRRRRCGFAHDGRGLAVPFPPRRSSAKMRSRVRRSIARSKSRSAASHSEIA